MFGLKDSPPLSVKVTRKIHPYSRSTRIIFVYKFQITHKVLWSWSTTVHKMRYLPYLRRPGSAVGCLFCRWPLSYREPMLSSHKKPCNRRATVSHARWLWIADWSNSCLLLIRRVNCWIPVVCSHCYSFIHESYNCLELLSRDMCSKQEPKQTVIGALEKIYLGLA